MLHDVCSQVPGHCHDSLLEVAAQLIQLFRQGGQMGLVLARSVGDGLGQEVGAAKVGTLPCLPIPLQQGIELLGCGVKPAPEDTDLRLRCRYQHLV